MAGILHMISNDQLLRDLVRLSQKEEQAFVHRHRLKDEVDSDITDIRRATGDFMAARRALEATRDEILKRMNAGELAAHERGV